jgi:hypothetical protein
MPVQFHNIAERRIYVTFIKAYLNKRKQCNNMAAVQKILQTG